MEDNEIIELYNVRSEFAIAETEKKYGGFCRSIAFNILENKQDTDECVNDTFWNTWNAIPPQQPRCLSAFLGKITRNLSFDRLKKQNAQKRGGKQIDLVFEELSACIPDKMDLQRISDDIVIRETLDHFIKELPEIERWVFVRRYWHTDTISEIAVYLKTSENNVYILLHRIRKKLKAMLEKEGVVI